MNVSMSFDLFKVARQLQPPGSSSSYHSYDMILENHHQASQAQIDKKIKIVLQFAKHFPLNHVHHFITSTYPLEFISVILYDKNDLSKHEIKITTEANPDPEHITDPTEFAKECISWRSEWIQQTTTIAEWKGRFNNIVDIINKTIEIDHGVVVTFSNTRRITLHFADALILMFCRKKKIPVPKVSLPSLLLNDDLVALSSTDNFWDGLYQVDQEFLIQHVDAFWLCFSYWGNHSYIPNRIEVPDVTSFSNSYYLSNRKIFEDFMAAKMMDLRRSLRLFPRGVEERYEKYGVKYESDTNLELEWYTEV